MCKEGSLISGAHNETFTSAPAAGDVPAEVEYLPTERHDIFDNVTDKVTDIIHFGGAANGPPV